nr:hypothetical protein YXRTKSLT_YXRTKSLT_CDS_0023 [uncultured phage]CAI9752449.1 hypothetical protein IPSYOLDY_IPSYOLDY_CDS_0023 [uncultured phage]
MTLFLCRLYSFCFLLFLEIGPHNHLYILYHIFPNLYIYFLKIFELFSNLFYAYQNFILMYILRGSRFNLE